MRRETNNHRHSRAFSQSETLTLNSCHSLDYTRGNEYIIYFTDLCKLIETYIYARKKHPFARYPAAKHSKQQICHTRKTSELFFLFNTGVDFSLRNNFANSGSFSKVSVRVHNYNSLIQTIIISGVIVTCKEVR